MHRSPRAVIRSDEGLGEAPTFSRARVFVAVKSTGPTLPLVSCLFRQEVLR